MMASGQMLLLPLVVTVTPWPAAAVRAVAVDHRARPHSKTLMKERGQAA
jgi:hypothetical protein